MKSTTGIEHDRSFKPMLLCVSAFMACGPQQGGAQKPGDKVPEGTAGQADAEPEPEPDAAVQEGAEPIVAQALVYPAADCVPKQAAPKAALQSAPTTPAGKPPDAGGALDEEDIVRETTLADLRKEDEKPGLVKVKAYFIKAFDPGPCPPHAKCEPCVGMTIISDDASSKAEDSLWVKGHSPKAKKLKKGKAYTFVLDLKEGYKVSLDTKSCDPRLIKISMYACLDCPGKGKK